MKLERWAALLAAGFWTIAAQAQDHGHLNVGASGGALNWENGAIFSPSVGYVKTLLFATSGKYAGFYQGNITLTALHSKNAFGEIDPAAPKAGAFIVGEIVSVEGPQGGAFAFWENTSETNSPTVSIPTGTTNAAFRFEVSEASLGAGQPGGDAFGHIHGRRFTATLPGIYTVGFRAHDTSANGNGGAPLHTSAPVQLVTFQAGVNIGVDINDADRAVLWLGAQAGFTWQVQAANSLTNPSWEDIGAEVLGDDALHALEDPQLASGHRFYRAVGTVFVP